MSGVVRGAKGLNLGIEGQRYRNSAFPRPGRLW
jgi:hypothetical protein